MPFTLTFRTPLPFRLNLKDVSGVSYSDLPLDEKSPELGDARVAFRFGESCVHRTVLSVEIRGDVLASGYIEKRAINECRDIVNMLVRVHQSVTGEVRI